MESEALRSHWKREGKDGVEPPRGPRPSDTIPDTPCLDGPNTAKSHNLQEGSPGRRGRQLITLFKIRKSRPEHHQATRTTLRHTETKGHNTRRVTGRPHCQETTGGASLLHAKWPRTASEGVRGHCTRSERCVLRRLPCIWDSSPLTCHSISVSRWQGCLFHIARVHPKASHSGSYRTAFEAIRAHPWLLRASFAWPCSMHGWESRRSVTRTTSLFD
jgi:hypothetical protein